LQHRSDVLSGIVNGINCDEWNPATDQYLAANYTVDTVAEGKPLCKAALQKEFGLPQRPDAPLVGVVGRIAHQKGFDLIAEIIPGWAHNNDVQWVLLGTGDPRLEQTFRDYTRQYPDKVAVKIGFCDESAHLIEAGADMFMMPSRFEPCGLNQMYSLQYGTVPVVRETGGLADTVVDATDATLANGTANGFSFRADTGQALGETLWRACQLYQQPDQWLQLVTTGMQQDWSWTRSAQQYAELYWETSRRGQTSV
jgi:starch synthase